MKKYTRIILRIATIEATSAEDVDAGKTISGANYPFVVEDRLLASGASDEVNVATLGRIVAAASAALAPKFEQCLLDSPCIIGSGAVVKAPLPLGLVNTVVGEQPGPGVGGNAGIPGGMSVRELGHVCYKSIVNLLGGLHRVFTGDVLVRENDKGRATTGAKEDA